MAIATVRPGQLWLLQGTGERWLVTKVYAEDFSFYAMLRKVGGGDDDVRRLKIAKTADGVALSGFRYSQGPDQL